MHVAVEEPERPELPSFYDPVTQKTTRGDDASLPPIWPDDPYVDTESVVTVRPEKVVVHSEALTEPLVLPDSLREAAERTPPHPSPSGLSSYEDALAAVFSHAGLAPHEGEAGGGAAPPKRYSPEQVVAFLSALPSNISLESRYAAMEVELETCHASDPVELVGDAAMHLVQLRKELILHNAEQKEASEATQWRINLLKAELERMYQQLADREREGQEIRQELLTKVDEMTGVIVFFDGYQAYLYQRAQTEVGTSPTFLDNATALRLLDQRKAS